MPHPSLPTHLVVFRGVTAYVGFTNLAFPPCQSSSLQIAFELSFPVNFRNVPITVVWTRLRAQQRLFSCLVGIPSPYLIPICLCLEHGSEMNAAPHLFAREFAVERRWEVSLRWENQVDERRTGRKMRRSEGRRRTGKELETEIEGESFVLGFRISSFRSEKKPPYFCSRVPRNSLYQP